MAKGVVKHADGKVCLDCAMGNLLIELTTNRLRVHGTSELEISLVSSGLREEWEIDED